MSDAFEETKNSLSEIKGIYASLDVVGRAQFIGYVLGPIICCIAIAGYFGWWGVLYDLGCLIWWYGWIGAKNHEV